MCLNNAAEARSPSLWRRGHEWSIGWRKLPNSHDGKITRLESISLSNVNSSLFHLRRLLTSYALFCVYLVLFIFRRECRVYVGTVQATLLDVEVLGEAVDMVDIIPEPDIIIIDYSRLHLLKNLLYGGQAIKHEMCSAVIHPWAVSGPGYVIKAFIDSITDIAGAQ